MSANPLQKLLFGICIFSTAFFACKKVSGTVEPRAETIVPEQLNINASLTTPNPSFEANKLYQFLKDNYGKMTLDQMPSLKN